MLELAKSRESLVRRVNLVAQLSSESETIVSLGRRVVSAVSEEVGAPVVLLHAAPIDEPLAPEVVASIGVSSVGVSPPAVREVMLSGMRVAMPVGKIRQPRSPSNQEFAGHD